MAYLGQWIKCPKLDVEIVCDELQNQLAKFWELAEVAGVQNRDQFPQQGGQVRYQGLGGSSPDGVEAFSTRWKRISTQKIDGSIKIMPEASGPNNTRGVACHDIVTGRGAANLIQDREYTSKRYSY